MDSNKKKIGSSCHQCKNMRRPGMLMYCTNTFLTRAKKLRSCRKKYCASCLSKYVGPTGTLPTESTFICASCQGVCVCAACKRKLTDSLKTSLKKENRAKGKKKTSAKSRKNISHKYTDKDEGATSSCWNQTHDEASPIHHTIKAVMSNVDDISAGDVHSTNTNFSSPTDTLPGNAHSAAVDPRTAGAYSLMGDMVFVDDTALLTGTDSATAPKSALNYNSLGGAIVNTHSNTSIGRHLTLLPADNRDQGVAGKRKVSETEKRRGGQHKSRRKSSSVTLKKKDSGKKSKQIGVNGQKQSNRKQESSIETGSSTRDMAVLEQVRDRDKTLQSGYSGRSFHYSSRAHTMSMGANHMKYDMESSVKDKITSVTDDCRDMDGQHTSIASNVCLTNSLLPSHSSVQSSYYTAELENEKAISHPITVNSNSSKNRRNEDAHSRMTFLPNSCRQYYGDYIGDVQDPFTSSSSSSSSLRPPSPMFTSPTASSNPLPLSGPSRSLVTSHADGTSNDKHSSVFLSSSLPDGEDSRYFTPPAYSSASAPPSFPLHHSSSQLHPFSHRSSSADYFLDSGVQQRYEDREQPDSKPWHRSQAQTYLYARYQAKTSQLGSKPLPGDIIPRDGATSIKTTGQRPSSPKSVHSYPHDRQQMMRAMMDNDSNRGDPDTFIYGSSRSRHNSHCHHTSASEVEALRGVVPDPYIEGNNSNNSSRNSFSDQSFNRDPTRNYSRNLWSSTDRHKGTNVSSKAEEESGEDFMNFMVNSDEEALDGDENDGVTHETSERRDEKQRKEGDGQSSREAGCMSSYIPVPSVYRSMNKRCVGGGNTHYNDNSGFRGRSGKVGDTGGHTSVSCSRDDPNVDAYKLSDNSIWTSSKCTPQSVPLYPVTTLSARASLLGSDTQSEPSSSMRCASIDREHSAVRLFSASHSSVHSSPKAAVSSSPIAFQFPSVRYQCSQSLRNLIMKKQHGRQYSKSSSREIRRKDDFRSESGRICRSMSNSSNSSMQNDDIDSRSVISMRSMRSTSSHSTVGATALSGLRLYSPLQRAQTLRSGIHGSSRASTSSTNSSNSDVIYNFASDVDTSTSSNVNTMDGPGDYVSSDSECTRADANSKANAYLLEVLKTRWNSLKSHNLHQLRNMTPRSTAQISPSSPQPSPYTAASFSSSLLPTSCGAGTAQAFSSPSVQTQSAGSVSTSYTNFKANRSTKSFDQSSEGIAPFDDPLCRKSPRQTGASGVGEETVTPADAQMKAVENIVKSYSIGAISSMFECGLLSSNQRLGPQLLPPAPGGANAETDVNSTSSAGHIQTTNVNAFANITQGETNSAFALQNHIGDVGGNASLEEVVTKIANTLEEPVVQRLVRMLKKGNDERTQERVGDASNVYFSTNTDKESIGVHSTHHSFTSLPQQVQVEIPSDVQKQIQQEQVQLRSAPSPQISHVRQRVHEQFAWRRGPCNDEAQKENDESTQLSNGVVASTRVKTSITATPKNGCIRSENQCVSTSESAASVGRNYDIKKQTDATQSKASPVVSLPISQPPSDGATGPTSRSVLTFQPSDLQGFSPFPLQTQVHTPLISASNPSSASYSSSLRPHSLSSLHQLSQQTLASHSLSSSSSTALQNSFADKLYQMQRQYQKRLHSIQRYHQEQQQVQQPRGAQQGFPTPVAHVNHSHKVSDDYLSSVFRRHRQHQSLRQSRRTGDAGSKETNQAALSMQTAVANMNKGLRNNNTSRYVDASAILDAGVSTTCDAKSSAGAGDVERAVGQPDITVMQRISSSLLHRAQHPRQDHQRIDETISDGQKKYEEASTGPGKASDAVSVKYEAFHIHSGGDDKIMSSVDGARVAKEATDNQDDHRSTLSTFSSLSPPPPSRAAPEVANANEAARSIDNCAVPSPSSIPSPATSSSMPTESEAKPPIGMQTAAQTQAGQGELIVPIHLPSPNRRRSLKREGCRRRYKSDAEGVLHALAPSHFSVPRSSKSGDDASENGMLRFVVSNESGVEASPSRQYRSLLRTPYSVSPVHSPFVTSPERRNEYFFDQPLSVDGEADDFLKNTSTERSVHVKAGTRNDSSPAMGDEEDRKEVGETTSCSGSTYDDGDTMPINSGTVSSGVDDKSAAKDNKSK